MSTMNQIYQQIAKESEYSEPMIKAVIEHTFAWLRLQLIEIPNDKILFTGLGTFKLLKSKMQKALDAGNLSKADEAKTKKLLNKYFKND